MKRRSHASVGAKIALLAMGLTLQAACASTSSSTSKTSIPAPSVASRSQLSYCDRLQPKLDAAGQQAAIGAQLKCLDLPGITALGRFGPADIPEEGDLESCFDSPQAFQQIVQRDSEQFDLTLGDAFETDRGAHAEVALSKLVPWLPKLGASLRNARRVSARVAIRDARFVTLVEVASGLQTQHRAADCLRGLCSSRYRYVHKALVGVPTAVLRASDDRGRALTVDAAVAAAGWRSRQRDDSTLELSSSKPVTIAIARSKFRTPYTEPLCAKCGALDEACCVIGDACQSELGCLDGRCVRTGHLGEPCRSGDGERACEPGSACADSACVAAGHVGQPCDGGRCLAGATCIDSWCVAAGHAGQPCENGGCADGASCVLRRCRKGCGGRDQPCCEQKACTPGLTCRPTNPPEVRVSSERVQLEGSLFGVSQDRLFGHAACGKGRRRVRFVTRRISGSGDCEQARWFAPERDDDCRVGVHLSARMFSELECVVEVYGRESPQERCQPY